MQSNDPDPPPRESQTSSPPTTAYLGVYLARFSVTLGYAMLATYIPEYTKLLDASPLWIGLFSTSFFLAGTITILPTGWLSDRYDKRLVLIAGVLVSLASYVIFAFVDSVELLTFGRINQGIGMTAAGTTSLALVGEMSPAGERAKQIGTLNAARNLSSALGAVAGGLLYRWFGFTVPYTILIFLTTTAVILTLRHVPADETRVEGGTFRPLLGNHRIQAMAAFRSTYSFSVMLVRTYIPIYAGVTLGMDAFQVGLIIASEKLTNMAAQRYTGILSDRYGRFPLVLLGGGLYTVGVGLISSQKILITLAVVNGFLGVADSIREPASMALFADEGKKEGGIASSFSVRGIIWRPGSVLAPMIGGLIMGRLGILWVFYLAFGFGLIAVMGIPAVLMVQGRLRKGAMLS